MEMGQEMEMQGGGDMGDNRSAISKSTSSKHQLMSMNNGPDKVPYIRGEVSFIYYLSYAYLPKLVIKCFLENNIMLELQLDINGKRRVEHYSVHELSED